MACVDLREKTPPGGEKPVHRRLLTSREAETVTDAPDIAARSARRRRIKEPLRRMKRRGFDSESLAIRDAGPVGRLVLACFIAASVGMQMTAEPDGAGPQPLTEAVDPQDRRRLEALEGKTDRQRNPRQPRLRHIGLRKARRPDRPLRQTRPRRHPARRNRVPDPQARLPRTRLPQARRSPRTENDPATQPRCVNLIARRGGRGPGWSPGPELLESVGRNGSPISRVQTDGRVTFSAACQGPLPPREGESQERRRPEGKNRDRPNFSHRPAFCHRFALRRRKAGGRPRRTLRSRPARK